jgi:hypothetical protein
MLVRRWVREGRGRKWRERSTMRPRWGKRGESWMRRGVLGRR